MSKKKVKLEKVVAKGIEMKKKCHWGDSNPDPILYQWASRQMIQK